MITHEICRDEMSAWLDGELSRDRAGEIRAHLDACAACSGHLAELRRVSQDVRGLPRETMPADLKADILRQARRVPAAPRRALWTFAASSLAAAAALVLIVVVLRQSEPGLPQPALTVEQERAASAADLDDGTLAPKQAAVFPEKKAGEGYLSGGAKEAAEPAPAAPPPAIAGRTDKFLKDDRAGAEASRRDVLSRSEPAAEVPQKSGGQRDTAGPQELMGLQKSAALPAQDEELERQEKAATEGNAVAAHYAAVLLESPGAMVLLSDPAPIPMDALSASRFNEADQPAGPKGKADQPSGLRERRAQTPAAAPTSATAGAAGAGAEASGLDASVRRVRVLVRVRVDAQGVIRELEPIDPPALEATRAARIRSLLAGRTLPGLLPGTETAILELTIRTGP